MKFDSRKFEVESEDAMNHVLSAIGCLACPLDGLPLTLTESGGLICPQNHSFDRAKQGYFNLLPVQFKPSKDPGDDKEMVKARTRALDQNVFEPLSNTLISTITALMNNNDLDQRSSSSLVDAGCGDGYYTARMAQALGEKLDLSVIGHDISKWAIIAATKRSDNVTWVVANNKRLPIIQGAASVITSLFGFETWQPWSQLQTKGQTVVTVDAASEHLLQLRERIYDVVLQHDAPDDSAATDAGYEKTEEIPVTYQYAAPTPETLSDILLMTPHGKRSTRQDISLSDIAELTIDVVIRQYTKR